MCKYDYSVHQLTPMSNTIELATQKLDLIGYNSKQKQPKKQRKVRKMTWSQELWSWTGWSNGLKERSWCGLTGRAPSKPLLIGLPASRVELQLPAGRGICLGVACSWKQLVLLLPLALVESLFPAELLKNTGAWFIFTFTSATLLVPCQSPGHGLLFFFPKRAVLSALLRLFTALFSGKHLRFYRLFNGCSPDLLSPFINRRPQLTREIARTRLKWQSLCKELLRIHPVELLVQLLSINYRRKRKSDIPRRGGVF